jgi:DNA-binding winged helix-turn-helix (wHTH) protein
MTTANLTLPSRPPLGGLPNGAKRMDLDKRPRSSSFGCSVKNPDLSKVSALSGVAGLHSEPSIAFGPFRLCPRQRLFLEGDKPLRLGGRAFDVLIALLERPGEVVSKQELISRVWAGIVVDGATLKVHVAALRRTLRDGQIGQRYISTVFGRGYCFVAPVIRSNDSIPDAVVDRLPDSPQSLMPLVSSRDLICMLAAQLSQQHFVVAVGAGDIAKGIFLAAALLPDYQHGVCFADLALLSDPLLVPSAICAAIGLDVSSSDPLAGATAFLKDKHMLLVLDNCRHIIGATAAFAANVLRCAPSMHILAL